MKTVAELVEFLKTQPQDLPVMQLYDGMRSGMRVFQDKGVLFFSERSLTEDYEDAVVLFDSERED